MTELQSRSISSPGNAHVARGMAQQRTTEGLPARVLIVNADCYRNPRVLNLLGLRDDHVIVCGQLGSMHRWGHFQHPEASFQCLVAPEGESTTDTALVFHAGALLAQNPRLRHVPWLIVTQDETLQSLLACLQHRRVRSLGFLPLYEGAPEGVTAYRTGDSSDTGPSSETELLRTEHRSRSGYAPTALGHELDRFIREQGLTYPVKGTRLRRVIEAHPCRLSDNFHRALEEVVTPGKTVTAAIRKLAKVNGFAISSTKVLAFNG
ncbi:hypothetical protein [Halomonas sp. LBP4]|uniref:hypothetical protein n=1 Tax=Halomonas sp. LBP4 TaxID=2044917 RepID=UPI000D759C32|nr:hypothetical protein [Halomonas sp. LBP4]PXX95919.1 hypothetical protein CR157_17120 [Halomonas sp. LBP4]